MRRRTRRTVVPWLRLVVGTALIALLCTMVPVGQIAGQLRKIALWPVAALVLVSLAGILLSALKLWLLVRTGSDESSYIGLVRAYYVGGFFNNFLPTSVGGDVFKIGEMCAQGLPLTHASASVLVERATGVGAVLLVTAAAAIGWPTLFHRLGLSWLRPPLAAAVGTAFLLLLGAYALWRRALKPFLKARSNGRVLGPVYRAAECLFVFRNNPGAVLAALALSLCFYAVLGVALMLAVRFLEGTLPYFEAGAIAAIARLPEMLPISVGALGVREGALTYCLSRVDVQPALAVAAALLLRLAVWIHSAVGGCVFALTRHRAPEGG